MEGGGVIEHLRAGRMTTRSAEHTAPDQGAAAGGERPRRGQPDIRVRGKAWQQGRGHARAAGVDRGLSGRDLPGATGDASIGIDASLWSAVVGMHVCAHLPMVMRNMETKARQKVSKFSGDLVLKKVTPTIASAAASARSQHKPLRCAFRTRQEAHICWRGRR